MMNEDRANSISVVVPVYNAASTIGELTEELIAILGLENLQVVLVNDGSQDNSHQICYELASMHPKVITYINLSKNFGEHNAVIAGLNYAQGDYVVIMDDDFQNPPAEVPKLINKILSQEYDVIYAYYKKKRDHWLRNLGSKFNNWVANFMLGKPKDLYLSSFKCINKLIVGEIIKYKGSFPYIDGLILRSTRNIGTVEVKHKEREQGSSGYTFRKLVRLWLNMFVNFSVVPLRLSLLMGLIFSCSGFLLSIYTVIEKIFRPLTPLGWPSLIITVMIFSGVQLFILGLLGEYIGHLLLSHNRSPQFVIRDVFGKTKI